MVAKANKGRRPAHLLGTIQSLAILNPTLEKLKKLKKNQNYIHNKKENL